MIADNVLSARVYTHASKRFCCHFLYFLEEVAHDAAQRVVFRCIKPNMRQAPNSFTGDFVNTQLSYTGMLETCRIRREGYSYRPKYDEFMERFGLLAYVTSCSSPLLLQEGAFLL